MTLFSGPIFAHKKEVLLAVLDNRFSGKQEKCILFKSHNVIPRDNIERLIVSEFCSKKHLLDF